jgi:hypothetical protein
MEERTFKNIQMVADYLRGMGYKVSKSTVYDHAKAGKIKARKDDLLYLSDVDQYANAYLRLKNEQHSKSTDALQRRRNEAEARKMEAQAEHWELRSKIASGAYVERDAFERALAQRAMVFKYDLESFARSYAPNICQVVDGKPDLISDLTEYLLERFAQFLNRYAENTEFVVPDQSSTVLDDVDIDVDDNDKDSGVFVEDDDSIANE